jgi:hypothetical protein
MLATWAGAEILVNPVCPRDPSRVSDFVEPLGRSEFQIFERVCFFERFSVAIDRAPLITFVLAKKSGHCTRRPDYMFVDARTLTLPKEQTVLLQDRMSSFFPAMNVNTSRFAPKKDVHVQTPPQWWSRSAL